MTHDRVRLTSLLLAAPYSETTHAGGRYVLAHAKALAAELSTVFYVPDFPDNQCAAEQVWTENIDIRLLGYGASRFDGFVHWLAGLVDAYGWGVPFSRAARRDPELRRRLQRSNIVELQWMEYIRMAGWIRKIAPQARLIGVVHDVVSQRIARQASTSEHFFVRITAGPLARINRARERRWLSQLDTAIVLSQKDAELVAAENPTCVIEVVHPDLEEPGMFDLVGPNRVDGKNVVFVGAFARIENETAAMHLMDKIWPSVIAEHPDAHLMIVGARPSDRMQHVAASQPSITVTGFVESIVPFYRSAHCAVIPLRTGAGVKFKTISAMLWGVPVVSTHVGTEGIGPDSLFHTVADTDDGLIDGLVRCLADDTAFVDADTTRHWARARFTRIPFEKRLREIYLDAGRRTAR